MNPVLEDILTRRSCRSFKEQVIPQETLVEIVQAGLYAPSARNEQKWKFTVLETRELIQELAKLMGKALGQENYDMYDPQVLIIPSVPKDLEYGVDDTACALENIFLAANSYGIGSCWINQMRRVIDDKDVKDFLKKINIPSDHTIYGMAALGYPRALELPDIKRVGKVEFLK